MASLRAACMPLHQELEDRLDVTARIKTLEDYTRLIGKFHSFVVPLESKLNAVDGLEAFGLEMPARLKTPRLERDLGALGVPVPAAAAVIPDVASVAAAMGCLYVLEGSTLGGQVLTRHFKSLFGPDAPVAYLGGYGAETGARWKAFVSAISAAYDAASAEVQAEVVRAARECFVAMGEALA